ncbi:MAG: tripartite tricarboxylate transporter permease [Gemmatimonadota bacterium]
MEVFVPLLDGFTVALTPLNLAYLSAGVLMGTVVGILPGLGPTAGIAILLPATLNVEPVTAIMMLAAIYYGAMYGATITAILINTPGVPAVMASTFDGHPLARQGRAGAALVMQAVASFTGGMTGLLLLALLAPFATTLATRFGPPEFFMLSAAGMLAIGAILGTERRSGILSALIGFALATIGLDVGSGQPRFTFGTAELLAGVPFIPLAIGVFGVGEILSATHEGGTRETNDRGARDSGGELPTKDEWAESRPAMLRGSAIGFLIGVVPGVGATLASLLAYGVEKGRSTSPERFGAGAMPGLAAPEAANNAAASGAMVPLLMLGVPGSAATAVLLGALLTWGLVPGPLLMTENPDFAWGLIASMALGNVALLAVSLGAVRVFAKIAQIPRGVAAPVVIVLCVVGAAASAGTFGMTVMWAGGLLGFAMKRFGFSTPAMIIGFVLAPLAEDSLRQTLVISGGSPAIFMERPVALLIGLLTLAAIVRGPLRASLPKGST